MPTQVGILGQRDSGQDVRSNNVNAVMAVANIVKSSLGPQGLDKMLVDDIGDVTITNDGATILRQLEVEHPAAQVIVELSQLQDKEVGDGTTSVVILAAEFLKRGNELIKQKVHPTTIITGFKQACRQACNFIKSNLAFEVKPEDKNILINCAKTSMSSKLIHSQSEKFATLAVDAILSIGTKTLLGETRYPIKSVNILKSHGQSSLDSQLFNGYALQTQRASQQMVTRVQGAKLACLDFNLNKFKMQMGIQVLVTDPQNLEKIRYQECEILKQRILKIIQAGANVILTTKGIDDVANQYLVEHNILGLRRVDKSDLRQIAKATGATIVTSLSTSEGQEVFDQSNLGECEEVYEEAVGDNDFIFFKGLQKASCASIIVRGANELMCDEIERSLHDSLCVIKRTLESGYVVPGGGCVEAALSVYLDDFACNLGTKEQTAVSDFAQALLVIPQVLANNAAQDATDLVAKLKSLHYESQHTNDDAQKNLKWTGLDLIKGKIRNNQEAGVLEPFVSKIKCLKFATEAAITILRIDDMIKLSPKQEEMPGRH